MSPLFVVILLTGIAIALGTMLLSRRARILRALRNAPVVRIADCADASDARIDGRIELVTDPLTAPLTKRSCVYYLVEVKEKRGKNSWKTIVREEDGCDFFVRDETGRALVHMQSATVEVHRDEKRRSGFLADATDDLESFLARRGHSTTGFVLNRELRYEEGVLEEGERVAVSGQARWEDDPNPEHAGQGYRDRPKRLVMDRSTQGDLLISDDPKAFR